MAVSTQVVRFSKDTSGTNGATQDVNLNFTPKAIKIISTGQTADNTVEANVHYMMGFSDGTNHAVTSIKSTDAQPAANVVSIHRNDAIVVQFNTTAGSTTIIQQATCTFATNKVTFTWTINDTNATDYILFAFGGSDITNAKVNTVDVGRTTTGTQDFTGLGFTPVANNSVIFVMGAGVSTINSASAALGVSYGVGVSTSKRFAMAGASEHTADPTDTWRVISNTHLLYDLVVTSGALNYHADFNGWITGGFQLNFTDAPDLSTRKFSYLVIRGGTWDTGTLFAPTTPTNNVDTTVSVASNTLRGISLASLGYTGTFNSIATFNNWGVGFSDGTNQGCVGYCDEDAATTTDNYRVNNNTQIVRPLATNGVNSIVAVFDSFPTTSSFRLDWTSADATRIVGWVVVADGVAAGGPQTYPVTISEPSISIGAGSVTRVPTYRFTISDTPTISVDQTLAGKYISRRAISDTPTITVGAETLVSAIGRVRTISDTPAVTIDQTIDRVYDAKRPITDTPTISVNQSLATITSLRRILTESQINISESLVGRLSFIKTILESPSITTDDSIAKVLGAVRAISDTPAISVDQTISRIQTILRQISETEVTVSDSTLASLVYILSIVESRIKWYYSLLTRKIPEGE